MALEFVKIGRFEMAKVKIIQGTVVGGSPVDVGSVVDVPAGDALFLIGAGRAVKYVEPEAVPEPEPKPVEKPYTEEVIKGKKGRK